tara:strand:+ start:130 stop:498 length:369 start_codon:yes stop_codon:yes gene_type:complete
MNISNSIEHLQIRLEQLSENKLFIGFVMILVNVGARFIIEELSDEHRAIVKGPIFRKIIIFCSVFMATRDIIIALIVTGVFTVIMNEILKTNDENKDIKQGSSAKQELDKQIDQLKLIKDSL